MAFALLWLVFLSTKLPSLFITIFNCACTLKKIPSVSGHLDYSHLLDTVNICLDEFLGVELEDRGNSVLVFLGTTMLFCILRVLFYSLSVFIVSNFVYSFANSVFCS